MTSPKQMPVVRAEAGRIPEATRSVRASQKTVIAAETKTLLLKLQLFSSSVFNSKNWRNFSGCHHEKAMPQNFIIKNTCQRSKVANNFNKVKILIR